MHEQAHYADIVITCVPLYSSQEVETVLELIFYFSLSSFCRRFEFDVSLQEVRSRKLDVSVKNNKMLFTRERKDIGMVGNATHDSLFIPGTEFQILFAVRRCHV